MSKMYESLLEWIYCNKMLSRNIFIVIPRFLQEGWACKFAVVMLEAHALPDFSNIATSLMQFVFVYFC